MRGIPLTRTELTVFYVLAAIVGLVSISFTVLILAEGLG